MTLARKHQIAPEGTTLLALIHRCVRKVFYVASNRRVWKQLRYRQGLIVERVTFLASVFKFDTVKFSGTVQKFKNFVESIKQEMKRDIPLITALE